MAATFWGVREMSGTILARGILTSNFSESSRNPPRIHHSFSFFQAPTWPSFAPLAGRQVLFSFPLKCRNGDSEAPLSTRSAFAVLGVSPDCSASELKAAFRSKVREFHPDVRRDASDSDVMIRRVIQAYEILSNLSRSDIIESECLDPFDNPECEALDVFVNETVCIGRGCPYSCVNTAPHAFTYSSSGTARSMKQENGVDFRVQQAVGQCPKSCIHYVTPSQRLVLEELLDSIIEAPYDTSAEAQLLYSLVVKAGYENNRYKKPKKQPKVSTQHVDWF